MRGGQPCAAEIDELADLAVQPSCPQADIPVMAHDPEELEALLAAARQPVGRCPLPRAELRVRLATSPWLRRLIPRAGAVARAEGKGAQAWERDPQERARALLAMDAIVAGTPRARETEALAREHLVEGVVKEALYWRPWRVERPDASSEECFRQALLSGRGVILSASHSGPYNMGVSAVGPWRPVVYSASGWAMTEPEFGYWGRRIAHRRSQARARGERLLHSVGSFDAILRLLEEGQAVSVFFGLPGSRATHFLGKPVMMTAGSARLATAADALILPIRTRRDAHRVHVDASTPLDPREHADMDRLHEALAAVHEDWILEFPAALEDPNRPGAWEGGATAQSWRRPDSKHERPSPAEPRAASKKVGATSRR